MGAIDWGVMWYAIPYMLQGTLVTLEISALAMVLGSVVGIICGFLLLSELTPLKLVVRAYVYFVRGTPALVQIFLVYFALPVIGIDIPAFWGPSSRSASTPAALSRRSSGRGCNRSTWARRRQPRRSA